MAFRDDLRGSVQDFPAIYAKSRPRGVAPRWRALAGQPGERPPYTVIGIGLAMLGSALLTPSVMVPPLAEVLRDGPSPAAGWTQPATQDLLSGAACIPIARLLENRRTAVEHSYSREVMCPKSVSPVTADVTVSAYGQPKPAYLAAKP